MPPASRQVAPEYSRPDESSLLFCYTTKLVSTRKAAEVSKSPSPHYHREVKPRKFHKAEASKVMIQSIWGFPFPTNNEDAKMIERGQIDSDSPNTVHWNK
jgi:hypothetical protein